MSDRPKIIVIDDDPTGSQTVHSCLLLTKWDNETLRRGLEDDSPIFFVLANTRAMTTDQAATVTREICRNLKIALESFSHPWLIASRSDSTLRGHYPAEPDVISEELGPFDAHFLVPAFFEGGRITRDGMHYVVTDGVPVPAHETPFARDSVFGYSTAYLPDYVQEKTAGRILARNVRIVDPRKGDTGETLRQLSGNQCCVVNAEFQEHLDSFATEALASISRGKRFLFRTAASLLTSLAGLAPQPVLPEEMGSYVSGGNAGLVLVGSHVPLSTRQLGHLLGHVPVRSVEVDVTRIPQEAEAVAIEVSEKLRRFHEAGHTVVISTSRVERTFNSAAERLVFGDHLSALLMDIVRKAPETLGFIVSKGGITSNDVLSKGLGLATARNVGQIFPGCSVIVTPADHRLASVPVVIFPGNVGGDDALSQVVLILSEGGS